MAQKTLNTRITQKIDISANWAKATNFVPLKGEIIIYSDLKKFKIGDGTTTVVNLAFCNAEKATYDDNGNTIASTYATKAAMDTLGVTVSGHTTTISSIQTAVNSKANQSALDTTNTNLAKKQDKTVDLANAVLISDVNKNIATSNVSSTQLEYLSSVTSNVQSQLDSKVNTTTFSDSLGTKVDKVSGKGLSTNDYTTDEKNKLAGIASGANNYSLPTASSTLGGVKTTSTVTSTSGYEAVPIINGIPYYKTYSLSSFGITATKDELNYVDGVTSSIQTQLNTLKDGKVNVVSGKGLSTNDYTTTEKNKLAGIASGAEVNQNAFSTIAVKANSSATASNIAAEAKSDTFTIIGGSNITLTADTANDTLTISATDTKLALDTALTSSGKAADAKVVGDKFSATQNSINTLQGSIDGIHAVLNSNDTDLDTIQEIVNYIKENRTDVESITSAKQDKITGAATTITGSNLTSSRVLVSDGNGKVAASSSITTTELGYLYGVTSSIQTQLNSIKGIADSKIAIDGGITIATSGSGNAVTGATYSNGTITLTKGATYNNYSLPTASSSTKGGVKTGATISSTSGYTPVHIDSNGVIYYKDTNTTYNLSSFGITATATEINRLAGVTSEVQTQLNTINDSLSSKASTSIATTSANGLMSASDKKNVVYFVQGTQTASTNAWIGTLSGITPYDGLSIKYYLPYAGNSSGATLALNGGTAYPIYRYGTTTPITTHFPAGSIIDLTFRTSYNVAGTTKTNAWIVGAFYDSDNYLGALCWTGGGTAAKTASMPSYDLSKNRYFFMRLNQANTAASALTLNVQSKGAKPIYINGTASSSSNYTLPAGIYWVYYDGTNYHLRTDNFIQANVVYASGAGTADKAKLLSIMGDTSGITTDNYIWKSLGETSSTLKYVWGQSWNNSNFSNNDGATIAIAISDLGTTSAANLCIDGDFFCYGNQKVLNAANYTDYTVTKTGSGASGTWNINAATADALNGPLSELALTDKATGDTYVLEIANGQLRSSPATSTAGIELLSQPATVADYIEGEEPDTAGMVLVAHCVDGSTKVINEYTCTPISNDSSTITYTELGKSYSITVPFSAETVASLLQDFTYTANADGTYTISNWNSTTNGTSGTEMNIPDNANIVI